MVCAGLLLLVGCRDRSTEQDHRDKLCAELGELDGAVAEAAALDASQASVVRLRELRSEMEAKNRDVQAAGREVDGINLGPINTAYNSVIRATNVNDQAGLAAAEVQIDNAAGEFATARLELHTAARCA